MKKTEHPLSGESSAVQQPLAEPSPVSHGGRVELRLPNQGQSFDAQGKLIEVVYEARWFLAESKLEGRVRLGLGDTTEIEQEAPEALPDWLSQFTSNLLRTMARQAIKEGVWPRRLTRWRKAPPSAESQG